MTAKVFQRLTGESDDDFAERVAAALATVVPSDTPTPFQDTEEY